MDDDSAADVTQKPISLEVDGLEPLPSVVMARVEALRKNQDKRAEIEAAYREERKALDLKYRTQYQPLYTQRADIVAGRTKVENETTALEQDKEAGLDLQGIVGVPSFWITAFSSHPLIEEMITDRDRPALEYLVDLRCTDSEDISGFQLSFVFKPNPYFTNTELLKTYEIPNMMDGGEPILENVKGTEIEWKEKHNLCIREVKKKQRQKGGKKLTRTVTKQEPCESFFQFFVPPDIPQEGTELTEEMEEILMQQIDADFEMGLIFRDKMVPHAVLWYTGEAIEDESDSDYDPDDDEGEDDEDDEQDDETNLTQNSDEKPDDCKNQ